MNSTVNFLVFLQVYVIFQSLGAMNEWGIGVTPRVDIITCNFKHQDKDYAFEGHTSVPSLKYG